MNEGPFAHLKYQVSQKTYGISFVVDNLEQIVPLIKYIQILPNFALLVLIGIVTISLYFALTVFIGVVTNA